MKTLHVPFHFYPEAVGGTEVYALSLVRCLKALGHEAEIAAPGVRRDHYEYGGVRVQRFAVGTVKDVAAIYGTGDELSVRQFEEILKDAAPDLVHLHGISPAISLRLLRCVKNHGIPVILTAHIPGIVCSRGTLLEHGTTVCDGRIGVKRCSQCVLEAHGLPGPLARVVGNVPAVVGKSLAIFGPQAGWVTALRMTELQTMRQTALRRFFEEVDTIVAVSEWLRQALLANGIPKDKVVLCRHGVTQRHVNRTTSGHRETGGTVRIAFLGRLNEGKGAHVLVDAVLAAPELPLDLDIYGIVQKGEGELYMPRLRAKAANDPRIRFLEPLPNEEVVERLREYDALAVPSLWLETGPLTVYDAFAAGIPVIGSRRAGIAELVTHGHDGLLVAPGDVEAWSAALRRVCTEPGLLERLRSGVRTPRTMDEVAREMTDLYRQVLNPGCVAMSGEVLRQSLV